MYIETVSKWAQEMEKDFQDLKHSPELEWLGAGCYVFFFYDLPKGQRLGIDNDSIVLYSSNPDCEGIWFHYFEENQTTKAKAETSIGILKLICLDLNEEKQLKEKINEATFEGLFAFWQKIGEHFPNAEGGDFPPDFDFEMSQFMEKMVKEWLKLNK